MRHIILFGFISPVFMMAPVLRPHKLKSRSQKLVSKTALLASPVGDPLILPRDSHVAFFEDRNWSTVAAHWSVAARAGSALLPEATSTRFQDCRVDPLLLSAPVVGDPKALHEKLSSRLEEESSSSSHDGGGEGVANNNADNDDSDEDHHSHPPLPPCSMHEAASFSWASAERKRRDQERATYFVTLGYDGTRFKGWQRQRDVTTVCGVVEDALNQAFDQAFGSRGAVDHDNGGAEVRSSSDKGNNGGSNDGGEIPPHRTGGVANPPREGESRHRPGSVQQASGGEGKAKKKKRGGGGGLIKLQVSGRTDAGVSAVAQACSLHTWEHRLAQGEGREGETSSPANVIVAGERRVEDLIWRALKPLGGPLGGDGGGGGVFVHRVQRVPRVLHPRWSATRRRYAYLLPLNSDQQTHDSSLSAPPAPGDVSPGEEEGGDPDSWQCDVSPLCARLLNASLQALVGKPLPYNALAFKELESKAEGGDVCTLLHASATLVRLPPPPTPAAAAAAAAVAAEAAVPQSQSPLHQGGGGVQSGGAAGVVGGDSTEHDQHQRCLLVEVVGDRFLRRMIRILVATTLRKALLAADALESQRRQTRVDTASSAVGGGGSVATTDGALYKEDGEEDDDDDDDDDEKALGRKLGEKLVGLLKARDRSAAALPAPPEGLCFIGVGFPPQ